MHVKYQLITTHEYIYSMQWNIKLRNNSQNHITILTLLFWVWKPLGKPKMGKSVQQSNIDFIMKKYGTFTITANSPKPGECSTQKNHWKIPAKPQHPPVWVYGPAVRSSMILLLTPPSSQLNTLSDFLSLYVSCLCQNISVCSLHQLIYFITLGKVKTLISLSL